MPVSTVMIIDHLAIAVRNIDDAANRLCSLFGYHRHTEKVTNTRQDVNVLFLEKEGSLTLKIIEPASADSPLWDFVRKGGGLHHVCFKAPDVEAACADLSARGARVIAPPQPGEAFDDAAIAFLYVGLGLNVEVIDTDRRRGVIAEGSR
jgi:methylmalonyl-CoA/ethylmalonyl-CoA epimerase